MARKLFERQGIRYRGGALATGVVFVAYTDEAGTVLADISATSGGSSIAGSEFTVTDVAGLGPASFRIWGPTDDTAVLYLRCPADPGLGVQEIEAEPEAGGGGVTDHGALTGLADDDHPHYATDTDLSTHAADTTAIHGISDTSALATTSGVTTAVSTHAGEADPHTGYVLESLYDAKGDLLAASADNTPAKLTAGANDTVLTADSSTGTGLKWAAPAAVTHPDLATHDALGLATDAELATHAGAADPHTGYVLESDHTSAAHDTLGLVTDAILATHEADTTSIHGIADTSALATSSSVTTAVSTHAGLTDPHTGYVLESLYDAKGDLLAGSAADTPAKLTAGANGTLLVADSATGTGLKYATVTEAGAVTTTGGGKETVQAHGATGSTETIDLASGNVHSITLDSATVTLTFAGSTASVACSFTLLVAQDGTGGRLIAWPASVDWPSGVAPTLSTGINKVDVFTFVTVDNGTTWLGFTAGLDLR